MGLNMPSTEDVGASARSSLCLRRLEQRTVDPRDQWGANALPTRTRTPPAFRAVLWPVSWPVAGRVKAAICPEGQTPCGEHRRQLPARPPPAGGDVRVPTPVFLTGRHPGPHGEGAQPAPCCGPGPWACARLPTAPEHARQQWTVSRGPFTTLRPVTALPVPLCDSPSPYLSPLCPILISPTLLSRPPLSHPLLSVPVTHPLSPLHFSPLHPSSILLNFFAAS